MEGNYSPKLHARSQVWRRALPCHPRVANHASHRCDVALRCGPAHAPSPPRWHRSSPSASDHNR
eukprot:5619706-Pleurochrysis_carterae.AAC.1